MQIKLDLKYSVKNGHLNILSNNTELTHNNKHEDDIFKPLVSDNAVRFILYRNNSEAKEHLPTFHLEEYLYAIYREVDTYEEDLTYSLKAYNNRNAVLFDLKVDKPNNKIYVLNDEGEHVCTWLYDQKNSHSIDKKEMDYEMTPNNMDLVLILNDCFKLISQMDNMPTYKSEEYDFRIISHKGIYFYSKFDYMLLAKYRGEELADIFIKAKEIIYQKFGINLTSNKIRLKYIKDGLGETNSIFEFSVDLKKITDLPTLRSVIFHELGHILYWNLSKNYQKQLNDVTSSILNNRLSSVTDKYLTNPEEVFARLIETFLIQEYSKVYETETSVDFSSSCFFESSSLLMNSEELALLNIFNQLAV